MNLISFIPEHYISICLLLIFSFFSLFVLSNKYEFPFFSNGSKVISVFVLLNYLLLSFVDLSFSDLSFNEHFTKTEANNYYIIIMTVFSLITIVSVTFFNKIKHLDKLEFYILLIISLISVSLLLSSNDIISFYFLLELQGMTFYILAAYNRSDRLSIEAGIKYLVLNSLSSILLLLSFSFIYAISGNFSFIDIYSYVPSTSGEYVLLKFSFVLLISAFLFKVYCAPFHFWISDVYEGTPLSSLLIFTTVPLISIFYSFTNFIVNVYHTIFSDVKYLLEIAIIFTIVIGTLLALYQRKMKKIIAYSSVTNIGYILSSVLLDNSLNLQHGFFFIIFYLLNIASIIVLLSNLYDWESKTFLNNIYSFSGFYKSHRNYSILLMIYLFSLGGIPPFSFFIAKLVLFSSLLSSSYFFIVLLMLVATFLTSFYYLRIVKVMTYNQINNYCFIKPINYQTTYLILLLSFFQIAYYII